MLLDVAQFGQRRRTGTKGVEGVSEYVRSLQEAGGLKGLVVRKSK